MLDWQAGWDWVEKAYDILFRSAEPETHEVVRVLFGVELKAHGDGHIADKLWDVDKGS